MNFTFRSQIDACRRLLLNAGKQVDTGHWQGVSTEGKPDLQTVEVLGVNFDCAMPRYKDQECSMEQPIFMLRDEVQPNLPWADDHFAERVSRVPSNPGEEYKNWPWWRGQELAFANETADLYNRREQKYQFSHTYQERYWPKKANSVGESHDGPAMEPSDYTVDAVYDRSRVGIRYKYGDLDDLVALLLREPYTRQAWLPIFFPEDTGAAHRGRIPCTLGYHFMLRDGKLHMWYVIRSCDYVRHFRDDLYLSARLLLWVLEELQNQADYWLGIVDEETAAGSSLPVWSDVNPGTFHFHCFSLHYHKGDEHLLRKEVQHGSPTT